MAQTRVRFGILALISGCVTINYLDRALLGVSMPAITSELALRPAAAGIVLSAFSWTYFLAQIPAGVMLDRLGARVLYAASLISWSLVTLLHALTVGLASLLGLRFLLGLAEAPCFPANSNVVAMWFPRSERARAIGVYTAAEYVGLSFLSPILFWILATFGWRTLFFVSGSLGVVYAFVFVRSYRDPAEHAKVSQEELDYIAAGGGVTNKVAVTGTFRIGEVLDLLRQRQILGLCIGQFSVYSTFVFFLTWFPTYLATERHMAWIHVGIYSALPYIAGFFGILFAGWWSDFMLQRGCSLSLARKLPVIVGLVLASSIVTANIADSNIVVVAILSIAFFAQAMSSSGWSVISEVAPKGKLGLVGGLFSASANLSGIVTPLVVGWIVQATGSFIYALAFVGAVAMIGALSWIFVIGDLTPVRLNVRSDAWPAPPRPE
ncbi:MAG: MFS transporter [Gammaproteobacteria bacterium]|nr:MFS transporter [Gammaproteobacteria bacterium]